MQVQSAPWLPQPFGFGFGLPVSGVGLSSGNLDLIAAAASLRLSHQFIHFRLQPLLGSFFQKLGRFRNSHGHFYRFEKNLLSSRTYRACFCLFDGWEDTETRNGSGKLSKGVSNFKASSGNGTVSGRQWTNLLLAVNVLLYVAQIATQGKLLVWGAKINSLVDKGQLWRLVTSSFLHANVGHLMVNCYSLNSIGPTMEKISGPRRYLALYFASAVTSSTVSYWFSKAPSIGASGAIFGLVGSMAVFVVRHRGLFGGGKEELQDIVRVIALNMVIGLLSKRIDNWGHLGGFLGGVATSWFLGPAWKYESLSKDGRRIFSDRAPIAYLINRKKIL